MKKILLTVLAAAFFSSSVLAQQDPSLQHRRSGPRRQLATIVFAGLGGAILGLSTLSFYGRPQEHLSNIAVGFAIGVIGGTAYVTVRSATTRDYFDEKPPAQGLLLKVPEPIDEESKQILWSPFVARADYKSSAAALGEQLLFRY